jgi:hypothetical protein
MVIVKAATVMEYWITDFPDDYLIHVSDSGYSNDKVALNWLKHFDKMTKCRRQGAWRLLLINGHGSHETKEFAKYAEENKIQLFALPPHTTHLLQPLDNGCFQPLKWYHGRCLDWAARSGEDSHTIYSLITKLRSSSRRATCLSNTVMRAHRSSLQLT